MSKVIKKALIPAAGFGTRFLPQTKAMPKEMMPLVDKPIIQRVVEELVEVGVETIVIVTGWNKRSIEDHFDNHSELEEILTRSGKTEELEIIRKISNLAEFVYIRQKGPQGNATPILNAKHILGNEPFMYFFGDDFIDAEPSRAKQLLELYQKYQTIILGGVKAKKEEDYKKYGFAGGEEIEKGVIKASKIVEKPGSRELSPSDLAITSGYILTPDIYEPLEKIKDNLENGQELTYTAGVQDLINQGLPVYALEIQDAIYRDTGNKLEYLKTVVEYGLKHPEFGEEFKKYLQSLKD
ncbi:NTP transferase domain-containing protein [Candidatus Daviesbacteria bacterium]|nr:NTP transferase domain-containing protein [Candidatus Daviesbacteria bacterium]